MSKSARIGLSLALLVAAVVLYVLRSGGGASEITARTDFDARVKCRACQAEYLAKLDIEQVPPYKCQKCGKNEAWSMWQCNECGTRFLPDPVGDPPRPPMAAACPKCKSLSTGAASTTP